MNFGQAIEALKQHKKVARKGWNGKGMFLYYVPSASYPPSTDIAKEAFGGQDVPYSAYIAMKTAQGNVVPWLASQTDVLAEDWELLDGEKQDRVFEDCDGDTLHIKHGADYGVLLSTRTGYQVICNSKQELDKLISMLYEAKNEMVEDTK